MVAALDENLAAAVAWVVVAQLQSSGSEASHRMHRVQGVEYGR